MKPEYDFSEVSINSERLILRPLSFDYVEDIFKEFNENVTRYLERGPNKNIDAVNDFISKDIQASKNGNKVNFVILDRNNEFIGLSDLQKTDTRSPEFGLWVKESAWGQGFGSELIFAMAEWAQDNLDFDYLTYRADPENPGSWKIAEKLVKVYGGQYIGEKLETIMGKKRLSKCYQIAPRKEK